MNIVDKLHKANAEEQAAKKALNNYKSSLEDTYGSLTNKQSKEINQRVLLRNKLL